MQVQRCALPRWNDAIRNNDERWASPGADGTRLTPFLDEVARICLRQRGLYSASQRPLPREIKEGWFKSRATTRTTQAKSCVQAIRVPVREPR
jgi:hypothetical protein